jgi:hypothetical protein
MRTFDQEKVGVRSSKRAVQRKSDSESLGQAGNARHVLHLQRTAGNSAVAQLLAGEEESPVKSLLNKGGGSPLPGTVQKKMEGSFGQDFSDVRVHTGQEAEDSAKSVSAKAYTVGDDIVFGKDSPSMESSEGEHTLAHELTHVVQQRSGPVEGTDAGGGIQVSDPSDRFEKQAEKVADEVKGGGEVGAKGGESAGGGGGGSVQREEEAHVQRELVDVQRAESENDEEETSEGPAPSGPAEEEGGEEETSE